MGEKNNDELNMLIRNELYKNMDVEYGKYTASLSPNAGNIIGVRIPVLRKMAKEIASVNWKEYLDGALDDTFEEVMLQGLVLGYATGITHDIFFYLDAFIPKIDDWAICDTLCNTFITAEKYPEETWAFLMKYMDENGVINGVPANLRNREFELRFVAVMMLNHFLNDEYIDRVLYALNLMKNDGYYMKMGVAWALAEAYVKYPEKTMKLLKDNDLDDFTFNKSIQKMQESFRISAEEKKILKAMKRK